ncbi:MAG: sugar ABC transporter permease [Lachnospiraceae bacterium]|nr:sugar ABC transporter permease [Lachnospiraceae bacterium]
MANKQYMRTKKIDIRAFTMIAILILLWLVFTFFTSDHFRSLENSFISPRNISNLARQMAIVGIMASSMTLVIVSGGIDLSAGTVAGFIGCLVAALQVLVGLPTPVVIGIALVTGVVVYLIQGYIIAYAGLVAFIVTLGGQLLFRGLILAVTGGRTIAPLNESLVYFGQAHISEMVGLVIGIVVSVVLLLNEIQKRRNKQKHGTLAEGIHMMLIRWGVAAAIIMIAIIVMNHFRGVPVPVLIMGIIVVILTLIAQRTSFGRSIYAIGGNLDAARYSGIHVRKNMVMVYMIHGVAVAVAGMLLAARLNASPTTAANMNLELDAIAGAVIGGTSMSGGVGKVAGAILGALIMATLDNGMSMLNMDAYWQFIVKGIILVAAVWLDVYTRRKDKK